MQVNNAQVFADLAAQIAANCPAAADKAKEAQAAADRASDAAELMSFCSALAETQQAQVDYWNEQAAMHEAHAEAERQRLDQLLRYRDQEEIVMSRRINSCEAAADCFGAKPAYANCDSLISECGCSSVASCSAVLESIKDNLSSLQRDIREAAQADNDSAALAEQARDEAARAASGGGRISRNGLEFPDNLEGAQACMGVAAGRLSDAERQAQVAAEDAAKACDVSLFADARRLMEPIRKTFMGRKTAAREARAARGWRRPARAFRSSALRAAAPAASAAAARERQHSVRPASPPGVFERSHQLDSTNM